MGLAHPLLPEACAGPFPVPALHVVHKKAPSPTVSNPMARFLPRNLQVFCFPSVHLLWYFRQGKGGGMPWTGMSSSSFPLL